MAKDGFERTRERTRARMHAAVRELVLEKGIAALSVRSIAERARISPVSIYNHAGGVRELVLQVAQQVAGDVWARYEQVLAEPVPFMEKLQTLLELRTSLIRDESWRLLSAIAERYGPIDPGADPPPEGRLREALRKLVKQGYAEGAIDPKVSEETVLFYILSFRAWFDRGRSRDVNEKRAKELTRLFLYGIRGPVPAAGPRRRKR